jgi:hypothetical protein
VDIKLTELLVRDILETKAHVDVAGSKDVVGAANRLVKERGGRDPGSL